MHTNLWLFIWKIRIFEVKGYDFQFEHIKKHNYLKWKIVTVLVIYEETLKSCYDFLSWTYKEIQVYTVKSEIVIV